MWHTKITVHWIDPKSELIHCCVQYLFYLIFPIHCHALILQVVSLRSGDLLQEEVEQLRKDGKLDDLLKGEQKEEVQGCRERDDEGKNIYPSCWSWRSPGNRYNYELVTGSDPHFHLKVYYIAGLVELLNIFPKLTYLCLCNSKEVQLGIKEMGNPRLDLQ